MNRINLYKDDSGRGIMLSRNDSIGWFFRLDHRYYFLKVTWDKKGMEK